VNKKVLVVGAGLAGAVCAQQLNLAGHRVVVIDKRNHIGGNCHTERDGSTGVMEHVYGPHIFNTSIPEVWKYVNKYAEWMPYTNRVKALANGQIYSLPINLHTINQVFNSAFSPSEAQTFISSLSERQYEHSDNFEGRAKFLIGTVLYEQFFYHYTKKQWGCEPSSLPASILSRLPIRFNYDDNYYSSTWQALPKQGYTDFIKKILFDVPVLTGVAWDPTVANEFDFVVYTGPIDEYYSYTQGKLGYRTVFWDRFSGEQDYQGTAVINHCSSDRPTTRSHEHKYFSPWEKPDSSLLLVEYSKETEEGDVPFYPKRLPSDKRILSKYQELAEKESNVAFCGRLGTYSYMNMDQVIKQALDLSQDLLRRFANDV
jgi:UDP-galactopyranose mutase